MAENKKDKIIRLSSDMNCDEILDAMGISRELDNEMFMKIAVKKRLKELEELEKGSER